MGDGPPGALDAGVLQRETQRGSVHLTGAPFLWNALSWSTCILAGGGASAASIPPRRSYLAEISGTDLSGPDIARELLVSLNTMRTHTKNIYMKLGVTNRREAARRADELGL
ncbi:MAG TPA: LuxR C-terminal-related transcriptional regulator [Egibacteraceae bacterium]|nr:LuxR C-terminal-related transcriptional regulator [Egibacteraceae bacterium]